MRPYTWLLSAIAIAGGLAVIVHANEPPVDQHKCIIRPCSDFANAATACPGGGQAACTGSCWINQASAGNYSKCVVDVFDVCVRKCTYSWCYTSYSGSCNWTEEFAIQCWCDGAGGTSIEVVESNACV